MYVRTKNNKLKKVDNIHNTCYYNEGSKHELCKHKHYCIFNENRIQLEKQIQELQQKIAEFEKILYDFINGDIIYHKELDEFYTVNVDVYTGTDGEKHYKTDVKVSEDFESKLRSLLVNLKYDLKNLDKFRLDVLHGKVDGYGY